MENGRTTMQIVYNAKTDTLYIRLDESNQTVVNRQVSQDVVLDVGKGEKIVGIEILDASTHLDLKNILPVEFRVAAGIDS